MNTNEGHWSITTLLTAFDQHLRDIRGLCARSRGLYIPSPNRTILVSLPMPTPSCSPDSTSDQISLPSNFMSEFETFRVSLVRTSLLHTTAPSSVSSQRE